MAPLPAAFLHSGSQAQTFIRGRRSTILFAFTDFPLSPKYLFVIKLQCNEPTIQFCKQSTYNLTPLSIPSPHEGTRVWFSINASRVCLHILPMRSTAC